MITILTDPIPTKYNFYTEKLKRYFRPFLRKIDGRKPLVKLKYGGHYAVTRSLIEGLERQNIPFVYNPGRVKLCTEKVIVLANLTTLAQAIQLKKKGIVKKLAAGPNLVILPTESPELIGSEWLDILILNSEWVKNVYIHLMPKLKFKTIIWPAGVNEEFWKPSDKAKDIKCILFYLKDSELSVYDNYLQFAKNAGFIVTEIFYGKYSINEYKKLLDRNSLIIYFGKQESQGISLLEAWSMDVPTIIWNPGYVNNNGIDLELSPAPYLSNATGNFFRDIEEFRNLLINASISKKYFPRQWVLQNMTDSQMSRKLLEMINFNWENS